MARQTIPLPLPADVEDDTGGSIRIRWEDQGILIDAALVDGGGTAYLRWLQFISQNTNRSRQSAHLATAGQSRKMATESDAGPDLTDQFETKLDYHNWAATNFKPVILQPTIWRSISSTAIPVGDLAAFITAFRRAITDAIDSSDATIDLILDDGLGPTTGTAPSFPSSTQTVRLDSGETLDETGPAASGNPTPTYSFGTLPSWVSASGRTLTGTAPTVTSETTYDIVLTATNSEGTDTWTLTITVSPTSTPTPQPVGAGRAGGNIVLVDMVIGTDTYRYSDTDGIAVGGNAYPQRLLNSPGVESSLGSIQKPQAPQSALDAGIRGYRFLAGGRAVS